MGPNYQETARTARHGFTGYFFHGMARHGGTTHGYITARHGTDNCSYISRDCTDVNHAEKDSTLVYCGQSNHQNAWHGTEETTTAIARHFTARDAFTTRLHGTARPCTEGSC